MGAKVSVILPSLNVADYISECIESALQQTLPQLEFICIDAGSTDGTWEKLQDYAVKDNRIRLLHSDIKSYGYQVNLGIKEASGKYIAILETDDYIDRDMYRILYEKAEEYSLDYIKADFDSFYTTGRSIRIFNRFRLSDYMDIQYGSVIVPHDIPQIYAYDYNLWKGIYNRQFLISNGIFLNESPGAAFQDIGFTEQVLSKAGRAMYTDDSLYRYRLDRAASSMNSGKGLIYMKNEFERLLDKPELKSSIANRYGFDLHMISAYVGNMDQITDAAAIEDDGSSIHEAYVWISQYIRQIVKNDPPVLTDLKKDLEDRVYDILFHYLDDPAKVIHERHDLSNARKLWAADIKNKTGLVYIFGAGNYGREAMRYLEAAGVYIEAFADNSEKRQGTEIYGIPVESPDKIRDAAYVVIANKYHVSDIRDQLLKSGHTEAHIFIFE